MDSTTSAIRWDIFCHVVDNFGDIGGAWRLACGLADSGQLVRLFADDASALAWMAPQGHAGVEVRQVAGLGRPGAAVKAAPGAAFGAPVGAAAGADYEAPQVVIAAFGCALPDDVLAAIARAPARQPVTVIRHEYLSAEAYVARSHGLASPAPDGEPAGGRRWFFFPGFTPDTGGLPREADLVARRTRFNRAAWLAARGLSWAGEPVVGLFCYEPQALGDLLLQVSATASRLLVAHGRSAAAVEATLARLPAQAASRVRSRLAVLPPLAQAEFDEFLWAADVNFVRGEDSLVRALWAGSGFIWQAYPQDDAAHHRKLEAFLDWMQAPGNLRQATLAWNAARAGSLPPVLTRDILEQWRRAVGDARTRLLAQDDLITRLLRFVAEKR
jgi:uncharacterized repeat protein (TIGR03837 family)